VTKKSVILTVAQRVSTIREADQIVVLDSGKVAGIGTHHELILKCKVYQEICQSQLSDAEFKKEIEDARA
jgi:ATP-binding cassette subfamily B protein